MSRPSSFHPSQRASPGVNYPEPYAYKRAEPDRLEAIAIIGFSLKFPQDATSPESLWKMLLDRKCASTDWPKDRINLDAFYQADGKRTDSFPLRGGHFLKDDLANFDAPFFSITASEAASMDPQQRLLLETTYRALENAGVPMESIAGTKTGVYTGSFADDHKIALTRDPETMPTYIATGSAMTLLANRVSWFFDLRGPSVNLDTACSSSMIALDVACQALRGRDSSMAIVGGVNTISGVEAFCSLSNLNMLGKDSRCYSFDDRANGYARGEGCAVLILKRISDAIADGDTIRAVVRSTGSNQDGHTPGITQPSRDSQEQLIRDTYNKAGLDFHQTRFFEAHGTGTPLGDPIESSAIGAVFREHRCHDDPIYVGAVKSNIGHLEGASAVAGLCKAIMAIEKGVIPPNTNFESVNPKINADLYNIAFPRTAIPWPSNGLRRVSVNSFGFGGANSHAVLDDAYHYLNTRGLSAHHTTAERPPSLNSQKSVIRQAHSTFSLNPPATRPRLYLFSAADQDGLAKLADTYSNYLLVRHCEPSDLQQYECDLAYTLATRRSSLQWKAFAVTESLSKLASTGIGLSRPTRSKKSRGLAYVFTGQGAQYCAMGRELLTYPIFKDTLLRAEKALKVLGCSWSLLDELMKEEPASCINLPEFSQPLCTALQIALVNLLQSFDIVPSSVVGHSSGEIAAAYCAGGLTLDSACKVAYFKGALAGQLAVSQAERGAMMAVGCSESAFYAFVQSRGLELVPDEAVVACINSPQSITLSGRERCLDDLLSAFTAADIFARKLKVDIGYHSPQMESISKEYAAAIVDLQQGQPLAEGLVMISSVTGRNVSPNDLARSEYWVQNMVKPVRYSDALAQLCSGPSKNATKKLHAQRKKRSLVYNLIEIGPHSALKGPSGQILQTIERGPEVEYDSILVRGKPSMETLISSVGHLYCLGYSVNLNMLNGLERHFVQSLPDLPEYPFNHSKKFWQESRLSRQFRLRDRHELLGATVPDWNPLEPRWRKFLRISEMPWLQDHQINGSILYPAAGMLAMAVEGVRKLNHSERKVAGYRIKEADIQRAIVIPADAAGVECQLYMRHSMATTSPKNATEWFEFKLLSYENEGWFSNCQGSIRPEFEPEFSVGKGNPATKPWDNALESYDRTVNAKEAYEHFQKCGFNYGPHFQGLHEFAATEDQEATAQMRFSVPDRDHDILVHPATLDAAAQLILFALSRGTREVIPTTVPTRVEGCWISASNYGRQDGDILQAYARARGRGLRGTESSMFAIDPATGELALSISKLQTTDIGQKEPCDGRDLGPQRQLCFSTNWKPDHRQMSPSQIYDYFGSDLDVGGTPGFYKDLRLFIVSSISHTLSDLDSASNIGDGTTPPLAPHLHRYIDCMRLQLGRLRSGTLPFTEKTWEMDLLDRSQVAALERRVETANSQGKFFVKVANSLLPILTGELDALQFIFKDDDIVEMYDYTTKQTRFSSIIKKYIDLLTHQNPAMKVLEIGAGTGSFTRTILKSLKGYSSSSAIPLHARYDFTDISPSFFEKAQEEFGDGNRFVTKVLDVERDPLENGYKAEEYDLVAAANVLHATQDLLTTLRNVRKLLKPGGKLVLLEITRPEIFRSGFIFGLLPGWWAGKEDFRKWSPCITEPEWDSLFKAAGFSGAELVFKDFADESCHEASIIVTTALDSTEPMPPALTVKSSIVPTKIIIDKACPSQWRAAGRLQQQSNEFEVLSISEAAAGVNIHQSTYLFLSELVRPFLSRLGEEDFKCLKRVFQSAPNIIWVTGGGGHSNDCPDYGVIDGLARTLQNEMPSHKFTTLALDYDEDLSDLQVDHIETLLTESTAHADQIEKAFMEIDGLLHIRRFSDVPHLNAMVSERSQAKHLETQELGRLPPVAVTVDSPGDLSSARFYEMGVIPLEHSDIEIEIKAVGLSSRDSDTVLGQNDRMLLGAECAGIVSRTGSNCHLQVGDRVAAYIPGCIQTLGRCNARLAAKIPDELSFADGALLASTFVTAYYVLMEQARVRAGQSLLIYGTCDITAQVAIQLAQNIGVDVYVITDSEQQKELVEDRFKLAPGRTYTMEDRATFTANIAASTRGRGFDVILINGVADDDDMLSNEHLAPFGSMIDFSGETKQGREQFSKMCSARNASFRNFNIEMLASYRPEEFQRTLSAVINMTACQKIQLKTSPRRFGLARLQDALTYLVSTESEGKAVVEMRDDEMISAVVNTNPSFVFDEGATYVIAGGLGGLGKSTARWICERGAKNLILLSRSGPRNQESKEFVAKLEAQGVRVETPCCDVTSRDSLAAALASCSSGMPPIKGCIQSSMVLNDTVFENMSFAAWTDTLRPKIQGSWNLHELLPPHMDFFILFSSLAGALGNAGQSNYAAGNTYQDELARHRVSRGEKGIALDLGWMKGEGYVANNKSVESRLEAIGGMVPVYQNEFFALLDYYCNPDLPLCTLDACQTMLGIEKPSLMRANGKNLPNILFDPLYSWLWNLGDTGNKPDMLLASPSQDAVCLSAFREASDAAAAEIVVGALVRKLSKALSITEDDVDPSKPLHAYGIDSLMAVEVRNWLGKEFEAQVVVFDIMNAQSVCDIATTVVRKSKSRTKLVTAAA